MTSLREAWNTRKSMSSASLSAAAGLALGLAWVAVRTFFDRRLYGRGDVEKHLGLRVLGVAPRVRRPLPVG